MTTETATNWTSEAIAAEEELSIRPLTLWRPSEFAQWQAPPGSHFLLPAYVTRGELTVVVGQGGVGKSRLAGLWLPICQITGREWCGLQTGGQPQKWVVLGDENSISRIKGDLERILANLRPDESAAVDERLRIQAIVDVDDADLNLGDLETRARIEATLIEEAPGAVVIDPLSSFAPGDISKPFEMKEAVRVLIGTVRHAVPSAAIVVLHHSRTGRANIVQGIGWDAANFGAGGKALYAIARCQINLMPGKSDDDTRLVLSCAKSNNCERFATRGLLFDRTTFTYSVDPDFDVDGWLADVEGRARPGQRLCTIHDVVSAVSDGYMTTKGLVEYLTETCVVGKRTVERLIRDAVEKKAIRPQGRGKYELGPKSTTYLQPRE